MIYLLAIAAALVLTGAILGVSMIITNRKAISEFERTRENASQDSGYATEDGYSIVDGFGGGGGD